MALINEDEWRQVLTDALDGIKGLGKASLQNVVDEYAPRLAAASSAEELDDLRVNLEAEGLIVGIKAETQAAKLVRRILSLAAAIAVKAAAA